MKSTFVSLLSVGLLSAFLLSCSEKKVGNNELSNEEKEEGWTLLFDGKTTAGWHLYNKAKIPSTWMVKNAELYCNPDTVGIEHGDLVSDKVYKNFDLKFDWKISKAGNSGVFINVIEQDTIPTAWASGPEYQRRTAAGRAGRRRGGKRKRAASGEMVRGGKQAQINHLPQRAPPQMRAKPAFRGVNQLPPPSHQLY